MSRGPGKVERAIEAAMTADPTAAFDVASLIRVVYPQAAAPEKAQRVSVLRSADKVASRLGWWTCRGYGRGRTIIYYNPVDAVSIAAADGLKVGREPAAGRSRYAIEAQRNAARIAGNAEQDRFLTARLVSAIWEGR